MTEQEEKLGLDRQSENQMRTHLRSRTWEEKVESIRRMNALGKTARKAMLIAQARRTAAE